ncbi:MAG: hypothetical protein HUU57_01375 [Bdellovibrio sp.]|nr:hypothetical protein [Bdellovibrio sp.]
MKIFIFALLTGMTLQSSAAEPIVVDVRRNITLAEDDPVYKDFYINADASLGLKKNMVVTAVRKINIRDASGASAVGEILVPVGQLKIIAVYDRVAVAREYSLLSRDDLPMLEQIGIMTGDRIDTKGSFIDNSKPKPKRKVAEETSTLPGTTVAVAMIPASTTTLAAPPAPATAAVPVESADQKANTMLKAPAARATAGETLEKTADSGDNTLHE